MYLDAVKANGRSLKYIPEELQDREICLAAVKSSDGEVMQYVPEELRDNKMYLAAKQNGDAC